ncbi:MAG: pantoate--beta-alanine ligase [Opitutaceae bacterium]|jgi:pantoate--beta-alanine ligase
MNKIQTVQEMQKAASTWRAAGKTTALIPTNGAMHAGHRALIAEARTKADIVIVSLFVNPLQFGPNENVAAYPRPIEADLALCAEEGADAVFLPAVEEIYPKGYSTYVTEEAVAKPLCGISRPALFRGVATVLVKLFNIVHPDWLVLGQKDAQMAAVARKVIDDLHFSVSVAVAPIVREADGLACNLRNRELTTSQRQDAIAIHRALVCAKEMSDSGQRSTDRIVAEVTHILRQHRRVRVIYISIVDPVSMDQLREVRPGASLLAIAVWVDEVRLTDNILI